MKQLTVLIKRLFEIRIVRALTVGVVAVTVQTIVFEFLGIYLQVLAPSLATVVGAEFGILTNFYLNNRFSFQDRQHQTSLLRRLLKFHLVVSGSVAIQFLSVFTAEHLTENLIIIQAAYAASIIVGFAWNYTWYKLWIWKHHAPNPETPTIV